MNLPPNVTEEEFLEAFNSAVEFIAPKFAFGYYDVEDIKQEAFLIALKCIDSYDAERAKLATFLKTVITRRLITLKRDKLCRTDASCDQCKEKDDCPYNGEKKHCPRYIGWQQRNDTKRGLVENTHTEIVEAHSIREENYADVLDGEDFRTYIDANLPIHLRKSYLKWRDGMSLPKATRENLLWCLADLAEEYGYHELAMELCDV